MGYLVLADATMVVHFAFIAYVVTGGFLAWRWPTAIWPHLAAGAWGFAILVLHVPCPLTYVEDWARRHAGEQGLPRGFIDHYLAGVVYPAHDAGRLQAVVVCVVLVSWCGFLVRSRRRMSALR